MPPVEFVDEDKECGMQVAVPHVVVRDLTVAISRLDTFFSARSELDLVAPAQRDPGKVSGAVLRTMRAELDAAAESARKGLDRLGAIVEDVGLSDDVQAGISGIAERVDDGVRELVACRDAVDTLIESGAHPFVSTQPVARAYHALGELHHVVRSVGSES